MANAQTRATKKYQAKMGIIRKSFTTHQAIYDQFKKACEIAGVSQNAAEMNSWKNLLLNIYQKKKPTTSRLFLL